MKGSINRDAIYLSLLVIFAAAMSFVAWSGQSIMLDEAQSIWQTARTLPGVVNVVAKDVHTPLYFILLHYWETLFGKGIDGLRLLSLAFYLFSIPAIYALSRESYSSRAALAAAFMTAVSPFLGWYGSEARMYSLLFLVATLSHMAFIRLKHRPSPAAWFAYGAISLVGVFSHPFFAFIIAVQIGYFLADRRSFRSGSGARMGAVVAVVGLASLAWIVYRGLAGAGLTTPTLVRPTTVDFFNVFSNFFFGFQPDALNTFFLSLWPVTVFAAFTLMARRRIGKSDTTYLAWASVAPVVAAFVLSVVVEPLFLSRYLVVALPSLYVVVAHLLSSYRGRAGKLAAGALVAVMVLMLAIQVVDPLSPVKEDWRSAAEYVSGHSAPSDIFVVSAPFTTYPVEYYYDGTARLATFPRWDRYAKDAVPAAYSDASLASTSAAWASVYTRVFLLLGYDQGYEEKMRLYMDKHYQRLDEKTFSPGLTLYVYKLRYITPET